jgi:hypothetical protein
MLTEQAKSYISGLSDASLMHYVLTGTRMYTEEAAAFAREELDRRKLTSEQTAALRAPVVANLAQSDSYDPPEYAKGKSFTAVVCNLCGLEAPSRYVEYHQNIGAVHARFSKTYAGWFCKKCNRRLFWKSSAMTLAFGWFGVVSLFVAPSYLIANLVAFIGSRNMPPLPSNATRPTLDQATIESVLTYIDDIQERIVANVDASDIARELAPLVGITAGQAWCAIRGIQSRNITATPSELPAQD